MDVISLQDGVAYALTSLNSGRLALLAGAGLSMAPPSSLPSAATIAAQAARKYRATYGSTRDPLPPGIEDQAEYFFQRGELATVYFRDLVDRHIFSMPPNEGHLAIADLLLINGIKVAVTTNVDALIENAGDELRGTVRAGIERAAVATLPHGVSPLLKIHGCHRIDPDNTVWAPGQLTAEPVQSRLQGSAQWLANALLDRDLLVVGYSTDWDYLNAALRDAVGAVNPSRVIVVDPADASTFAGKAPDLFALGERAPHLFSYVQVSGADFLAELRRQFSASFVRQVLHGCTEEFECVKGTPPPDALLEPPDVDNEALWRIRRDLEGCKPSEPSGLQTPPDEALLGLTILQLRAKGASATGNLWRLGDMTVRVLRAPNKLLHLVERAHQREDPQAVAPDIVIAVGADSYDLPSDIVRGTAAPTITRGSRSKWLTRSAAIEELDL